MSNVPLGEITIAFDCPKCRARVGWPDNATSTTVVTCAKCGERIGTYGDMKRAAQREGRRQAEKVIADLKKLF